MTVSLSAKIDGTNGGSLIGVILPYPTTGVFQRGRYSFSYRH